MHIYYFDENFKYQGEDVISDYEEMPKNATSVRPEEGLYLPMYDEKKAVWSESATQAYIDSLQPKPPLPNDITTLKKQAALLTLQVAQMQKGGAS
ncbi:hypothetical protein MKY83_13205 [Bacillus sp. FSL M8-0266]|uniref:hypothetical protein n=1 Tax=Bacillus TaxID=1386 RepID=UPI001C24F9A2|nr:hypothetical protein [Bacillus pumilus]MBU8573829.1 hypothetical protein [Bacillus pumilus]MCY7572294.1 hypothetical protein [Bacillus pumilus]MCY7680582.1 hypothetical protein [Bacillus pumilus]MEC3762048.1 hypothetical protein [Bacillus pumilus]WFO45957.1 hypothetical protein MK860_10225 [Bacillus pumilus]